MTGQTETESLNQEGTSLARPIPPELLCHRAFVRSGPAGLRAGQGAVRTGPSAQRMSKPHVSKQACPTETTSHPHRRTGPRRRRPKQVQVQDKYKKAQPAGRPWPPHERPPFTKSSSVLRRAMARELETSRPAENPQVSMRVRERPARLRTPRRAWRREAVHA